MHFHQFRRAPISALISSSVPVSKCTISSGENGWVGLQCESKKSPLRFSYIFPNGWEFLVSFRFLSTLDCNFFQLLPTVTKLCHIIYECDHPACVSANGGNFEHDVNWVVALNMAKLRQSCR